MLWKSQLGRGFKKLESLGVIIGIQDCNKYKAVNSASSRLIFELKNMMVVKTLKEMDEVKSM